MHIVRLISRINRFILVNNLIGISSPVHQRMFDVQEVGFSNEQYLNLATPKDDEGEGEN